MISFSLSLKEEGEFPKTLKSLGFEGKEANELFSKVKSEFASYLVEPDPDNEPFLMMKLSVSHEQGITAASFAPSVYFRVDAEEDIIRFIEKHGKL